MEICLAIICNLVNKVKYSLVPALIVGNWLVKPVKNAKPQANCIDASVVAAGPELGLRRKSFGKLCRLGGL